MIYLDCAATSYQKPTSVRNAVTAAMQTMSSPGRGSYHAAARAAEVCYNCRELAGDIFGCNPENVVFTLNATHAINIAINSLVSQGDRVVVSGYEHNAVVRPLHAAGAVVSIAESALFDSDAIVEQFRRLLPGAKACVCTHVSNVFGYVLPIERIAKLCSYYNVPLVVDASQSAGCLPINMSSLNAAFVAMPGHKSLLGPQGTGLLLCNSETKPILFGGTGSLSVPLTMPEELPDRLEAGTHNIPGIAGLLAGMSYVRSRGIARINAHENALRQRFIANMSWLKGVEVFASSDNLTQSAVVSLRAQGMGCDELASELGRRGVAVRAGYHCAPLAHKTAGTFKTGTVRFSFSPFNTETEITRTAKIMRDILIKS